MYYGGENTTTGSGNSPNNNSAEEAPTSSDVRSDEMAPIIFPQHGDFQKLHTVLIDGGDRFGVSTVTVDLSEELVWVGNQGGHVTSYYGNSLEKYTSFQVHPNQEIRQILTTDDFILILSQTQLRGQLRRGIPVFTHSSENMMEMQCMLQTNSSTILMGGHQQELVEFDLNTLVQTQTVQMNDTGCAILRSHGRLICTGEPTGKVHLLDGRTFRKEHTIEAHSGSLSDFDIHGNLMVTCGFSNRHTNLTVDRFLKVYDIRMLRALAPIQVSIDPFLLRFLPSFSSRIATVSPSGQMEVLETQALSQTNICLYQVTNASMCLSFDVSSSCHQMVFGDSAGTLHLFSSNPTSMFNSFSRDTEFPDPVDTSHLPRINILDEMASMSTIPLYFPNNNGSLASDWPPELLVPRYRRLPHIEHAILQSVKMVGPIGYAPHPPGLRRNQVHYPSLDTNGPEPIPLSPPNTNGINIVNNKHQNNDGSPTNWNNHNGHGGDGSPIMSHSAFPPLQFPTSPNHHNVGGSPVHMKHHQPHHPQHSHRPPPPPHHAFPPQGAGHHPPPPHQFPPGPVPPPPFFYNGPSQPPMMPPNGGGGPMRPFFHKTNPAYMKNTFYPGKRSSFHPNRYQIPKRYAKYEWKKNFFDESDMESFNRTKLSGLEFTQVNSYCNSMLQVLYHIDHLRAGIISHLCEKEACLSCELAFLFWMLDNTRVIPCVASNFLRAFRLVPEASALGLILQESQGKQRSIFLRIIQSFNRFILHQIEMETSRGANSKEKSDPISKLFAMKQQNLNRCMRCSREETKESTVVLSNILYKPDANGGGKRCGFIELLQRSLSPEQTTPAWCDKCGKYQATLQSRIPKTLPHILALNTCLDNAHDFQLWRNHMESLLPEKGGKPEFDNGGLMHKGHHSKSCRYGRNCMRPDCKFWHEGRPNLSSPTGIRDHMRTSEFEVNPEMQVKWLPTSIKISISDHRVTCSEVPEGNTQADAAVSDENERITEVYELMAVVCFIRDSECEERNNLVSIVQVDPSYFERAQQSEVRSNWVLFNDFCIREVPISDANSFNPKWKIPSVIYYRKKVDPTHDIANPPQIVQTITADVFKIDPKESAAAGDSKSKITYKPLDLDEIPTKGQLVAMDAEFVTLGQEETEIRSDGKIATIRPQMTVARITCIRGQGHMEGTPFLDDYISTSEVVVDYLTKFSGIKPGDLDVKYSSKNLTVLKKIYLKLRYLIDSGVKFVGHGLNNDFRVINLAVPPEQIIDTVSLFYLPNQRMISLRFLAWHFLGMMIQSEVHDSIEDARTALQLYRKYEELLNTGKLQTALEELYEIGKKVQWKVPNDSEGSPAEQY